MTFVTRILAMACVLMLAMIPSVGCRATPAARGPAERAKLSEPLAREVAWAQAIQRRDSLTLEDLLAPDFVHITETGDRVPRDRWLESVLAVRETLLIELGDARDRVHGALADIQLTVSRRPRLKALPMNVSLEQVRDTWARRDSTWCVVERRTLRTSSYLWTGREDPR